MDATVSRSELIAALSTVTRRIEKSEARAALGAKGRLYVSGQWKQLDLRIELPEATADGGPIDIDPRSIMAFLRSCRSATARLTLGTANSLTVECGGITALFETWPADTDSRPEFTVVGTMTGAEFRRGLTAVMYAAGRDEAREVLRSVLVEWRSTPTLVACDNYRLAMTSWDATYTGPGGATILPIGPLGIVVQAFRRVTTVTVARAEGYVRFAGEDVTAVLREHDGVYPNYRSVIQTAQGRPRAGSAIIEEPNLPEVGVSHVHLYFDESGIRVTGEASERRASGPSAQSAYSATLSGRYVGAPAATSLNPRFLNDLAVIYEEPITLDVPAAPDDLISWQTSRSYGFIMPVRCYCL